MANISSISNVEADILLIVWDRKEVTVREVYEFFLKRELKEKKSGSIPYTTIMSIMRNLASKDILKIKKKKRTHCYSAKVSRKGLAKSIIGRIAELLL